MKIVKTDVFLVAQQNCAFDYVAQFPYVAGPGIGLQCLNAALVQTQFATTQIRCNFVQKILGQRWNVFNPFAKGRERQGNRTDPEVKIIPKASFPYELSDILMRRGNQSYVDLPISHVAQPSKPLLLQHL